SAGGEWGGSTSYIVEYAPEGRRGFIGSWQQVSVGSGFLLGSLSAALLSSTLSPKPSCLGGGESRSCWAFWSAFSGPTYAGGSTTRPSSPRSRSTGKSPR